jgi:hypothetical protein
MLIAMFSMLLAAGEATEGAASSFGFMELVIGGVIGLALGVALLLMSKKDPLPAEPKIKELTMRVFDKLKNDPSFASKVEALFLPPPPAKPDDMPIRLLGLLQREARLVDFLLESISSYEDAQIGASVRDIHAKAQAVLKKHITLQPVRSEQEGSTVTVPAGFDPSAVQVVGNVSGNPPYTGTLRHAGWKATKIDLPKPPESADVFVIQPAEVEV